MLKSFFSCPPFTLLVRRRWRKLFLKECLKVKKCPSVGTADDKVGTVVPTSIFRKVFSLCLRFEAMPGQGPCLLCSTLDRDRDYTDSLCSDIPKSPVCPGLFASAAASPALAGLSFSSNLIHRGSCQLGASEAWGLGKMFRGQCPSVTYYYQCSQTL